MYAILLLCKHIACYISLGIQTTKVTFVFTQGHWCHSTVFSDYVVFFKYGGLSAPYSTKKNQLKTSSSRWNIAPYKEIWNDIANGGVRVFAGNLLIAVSVHTHKYGQNH